MAGMIAKIGAMRRADRLFQIVQILRRRRLTTASHLAEQLGISERTVYRDVRDLIGSGVPVEGEAGVGYRLRGFDLPPLMFTHEEVEALVLGARIVQSWTDPDLAGAAAEALGKIEAALPRDRSHLVASTALFAPDEHFRVEITIDLRVLRQAVREHRRLRFGYSDAAGAATSRAVRARFARWRSLSMDRSGCSRGGASCARASGPSGWTGCAYLEVLESVPPGAGRTLQDFLTMVGA